MYSKSFFQDSFSYRLNDVLNQSQVRKAIFNSKLTNNYSLGYFGGLANDFFSSLAIKKIDPWKITLIDTGDETKTGGRLLKVKKYIGNETFCFTYGDGLSNVNINETLNFHKNSGAKATITAVRPPGRYGSISINENLNVTNFQEK